MNSGLSSQGKIDAALNALHPLVDELHSIENKADTGARFCLTPNRGGVKSASFFDILWLSDWWRVRGSNRITVANDSMRVAAR